MSPLGVQRGGTNHFIPHLPPAGSSAGSSNDREKLARSCASLALVLATSLRLLIGGWREVAIVHRTKCDFPRVARSCDFHWRCREVAIFKCFLKLHGEKKRPWAPDPLMVGIRSPDGLMVGLAPATLEFWVRFPNERNQGKQGATLC